MHELEIKDFVNLENAEDVLTDALRLIMEKGNGYNNHIIVDADELNNCFAQFRPETQNSIYGEVSGNSAMSQHFQLSTQQIKKLSKSGWHLEEGGNFCQLWLEVDNVKQREIAQTTLYTLKDVYGISSSAELGFTIYFGLLTTESESTVIEQEYNEKIYIRQQTENQGQEEVGNGYIYILLNASHSKNILKIGKTKRSPELRADELSNTTGVPTRFIVAYEELVTDCDLAERLIHEKLKDYRINMNREFFEIPLKDAISVINSIVDNVNKDKSVT